MFEPLPIFILALAFGGPPAIAYFGTRRSGAPESLFSNLVCQLLLAGLAVAAVWLMLGPLSFQAASIGLGMPGWDTLALSAGIAVFFIFALGPMLMQLPGWLGLPGFEGELGRLSHLPIWYLLLAVVVGGITEEVLYRGVALTMLSSMGLGPWVAGLLVMLAFTLAHLPMWGVGPALTTAISGTCLMLFFLWHGDLVANIIGHIVTDFVGIVLAPLSAKLRGRM